MTKTQALQRCLSALRRPVSLAALLILVANDHGLRWLYPSWLTGKASDFGWLLLAPLVTLLALTWAWPSAARFRARSVETLAFGGTAFIFTLGKTLPAFNATLNAGIRSIMGTAAGTRIDPTDLFALLAVALAWVVWKSSAIPSVPFRPWHLIILPAFAILTLANTAGPDYGVSRLEILEGEVVAISPYGRYSTADGGLTWVRYECPESTRCSSVMPFGEELVRNPVVVDPQDPTRRWRFVPGQAIQISTDSGQTWSTEYELRPVSEAQEYLHKKGPLVLRFVQGPLDATIDPSTGNLIFAMGHQGVLVRLGTGTYRRVAVGSYSPEPSSPISRIQTLIPGELLLALDLSVVALAMITYFRKRSGWIALAVLLIVAAIALTLMTFPPAISDGYDSVFASVGIAAVTLACIALVPFLIAALGRQRVRVWPAVWSSLATAPAFAIPFVLWSLDLIPSYRIAAVVAAILSAAAVSLSARFVRLDKGKEG